MEKRKENLKSCIFLYFLYLSFTVYAFKQHLEITGCRCLTSLCGVVVIGQLTFRAIRASIFALTFRFQVCS